MASDASRANWQMSSIEEIIEDARNGRMFILVDDEDRENEGDLVIPAQMATPEKINFMAKHGRGLICLALAKSRVNALGLDLMSQQNGTQFETAFTVSIEAKHGVTTGISANDRARTIAVAINSSAAKDDIVTPGHVFPLVARDGGVLVRAGHTEAAVDVSRLAGLNPSGVICEILKADGSMARLGDLIPFAIEHDLKIGTIRDLIAYRRRHDNLVSRRDEASFVSNWGGEWKAFAFTNLDIPGETIALVKGEIDGTEPVLVRMHVIDVFSDALSMPGPRSGILEQAMKVISDHGSGVVVILRRDAKISQVLNQDSVGAAEDEGAIRDYGIGAQVLADLGIHDMILLTNSQKTPRALEGYGLNVVDQRPISGA